MRILYQKQKEIKCFQYEMVKTRELCLERITENKVCSTDNNILKRQKENEFGFMLPFYVSNEEVVYPREIDFETAKSFVVIPSK